MTILVTGAEGFLGKHLTKRLKNDGHTVISHCLADGDLVSPDTLDQYRDVDYVYHLAACTFVPDSWTKTYDYFRANIMGTVNVLEFCREQICRVALMSTYVYGEPQYLPVDENHPVTAVTPYHESKLICESLGQFYADQFKLSVTVFRPFNIYGAGQNEAFLIPSIVKQVLEPDCREVVVRDLTSKRDYVYVDDVVDILSHSIQIYEAGYRVFNIGSGCSVSVEDVIKTVMEVTGIQKPYTSMRKPRRGEISNCVADVEKVIRELKNSTCRSLRKGLSAWLLPSE